VYEVMWKKTVESERPQMAVYEGESNENLKYVLSRNLLNTKGSKRLLFLCSIVLPPVGHCSNRKYHCWNLQDNRPVVRIFMALL